MSTESARMPSLRDKLREEEEKRVADAQKEADERDIESKKGKGRRIKSKSKK